MTTKLNSPLARPLSDEDIKAAERLRKIWREKKKDLLLTQEKVAEQLDISQASVSKYLAGRIALNVKATLAWASILKVAPESIRPDYIKLFKPTINRHTVPLVAYIGSNGKCETLIGQTVKVSAPLVGDLKAVQLKTANVPGYFHGQIILFDETKPGNPERHALAKVDDTYCIVQHKNGKWQNVVDGKNIPENASVHAIVGSFFED